MYVFRRPHVYGGLARMRISLYPSPVVGGGQREILWQPNTLDFLGSRYKPRVGQPFDRSHNLVQGQIAWWIMNEEAGGTLYDISGFGFDATLQNDPTWITTSDSFYRTHNPGRFGRVLDFDGVDQYASVGTGLGKPAEFTISFWLNTDDHLFAAPVTSTKDSAALNETNWGLFFREGNSVEMIISDGTGEEDLPIRSPIAGGYVWHPNNFPINQWSHCVFVLSNDGTDSVANLWHDGHKQRESLPKTMINGGTTNSLSIGRFGENDNYHVNGLMDDIRVWDRALSPGEAQQVFFDPWGPFRFERLNFLPVTSSGAGLYHHFQNLGVY